MNVLSQRDLAGRVVIDETVLTRTYEFSLLIARDLLDHNSRCSVQDTGSARERRSLKTGFWETTLSVPRRVCGMLDVRDADAAKVADTVWTKPNFHHTNRWMDPSGFRTPI